MRFEFNQRATIVDWGNQLRYFDQTTNYMSIIGQLIEIHVVMFVITCVDFTQDFMVVQSAVVDTRRSIRN